MGSIFLKSTRTIKRIGVLAVLLVYLLLLFPMKSYAEPLPVNEIKALGNYPSWVASAQNCDPSGTSGVGADISELVNKNSLHSALIKEVGGGIVASHNATLDPATPASTMKLVIADVLLKSNADLNTSVRVGSDVYYDSRNDLGSNNITLKNALSKMLNVSSNTGANVLVKHMGGPAEFSGKATAAGYKNTLMRGYYSTSSRSQNDSSIADQVTAMENIFTGQGANYQVAQSALKTAHNQYNIEGTEAVKWGGTSEVTSSVALFVLGDKNYIIGAYINENSASGGAKIKQAFADLVEVAKDPSAIPSGSASGCCSVGSVAMTGENLRDIFSFLVSKGLSDVQAAGVVGNIVHESGGNPRRVQGAGNKESDDPASVGNAGYGIVQFTPGKKLLDIINATKGTDQPIKGKPSELLTQLEVLWRQLSGGVKVGNEVKWNESAALEDLKKQTDIKEAVLAFQGNTRVGGKYTGYERPADQSGSVPDRVAHAKLALRSYGGGGSGGSGGGCAGAVSGDLTATIKNYAWPTYRGRGFIQLKPGYKTAVNKAKAEGGYVGGTRYPGVDCGGFVTLAMVNSGYEPDYNSKGRGGNTIHQEAWMKENWQKISVSSTADLKPGDVAINSGHTFMYVGEIDGFGSKIASASWDKRAPMAGKENPIDSSYNWYRKKV